jgi:ATPase subunit of ABC transporter with duplicated ATPase domains
MGAGFSSASPFWLSSGVTGLVGPNGVGKTCLARILAGHIGPAEGSVQRRCRVRLLPQRENPGAPAVGEYLDRSDVHPSLGHALLHGIARDSPCNQLSGGQWMRVRLARALDDSFLILDEPTNSLDAANVEFLDEVVRQFRGALIVVSHDERLLQACEVSQEYVIHGP